MTTTDIEINLDINRPKKIAYKFSYSSNDILGKMILPLIQSEKHTIYEWYTNGLPKSKIQYNGLYYDGIYIEYYKDGTLKDLEFYKDGKRHGYCRSWANDSSILRNTLYNNGKIINEEYYYLTYLDNEMDLSIEGSICSEDEDKDEDEDEHE